MNNIPNGGFPPIQLKKNIKEKKSLNIRQILIPTIKENKDFISNEDKHIEELDTL